MKYALFLLLFIPSIKAQESCYLENYYNKQLETQDFDRVIETIQENSDQNAKMKCPTNNELKSKKEIIFAFDGAMAYYPLNFELNKFFNHNKNVTEKEKREKKDDIFREVYNSKQYRMEKKKKAPSPLRSLLFLSLKEPIPSSKEILYYSYHHLGKAYQCMKSIHKNNPTIEFKLIGYSWGGDAVQRMIKKMEKDDIHVKSAMTIDPVRKGLLGFGALKNIFTRKNSKFFKKNHHVERYYNLYQKTDSKTLPLIKIFGNSVNEADVNINLSDECFFSQKRFEGDFSNLLELPERATHINLEYCTNVREVYRVFLFDDF